MRKSYLEYLLITIKNTFFMKNELRHMFLTFSRRYSNFFRNENMKSICEYFASNICWLGLKILFFMKMNCDIFANFTSNICSLRQIFAYFTSNICSLRHNICWSRDIIFVLLFLLEHVLNIQSLHLYFYILYLDYLAITYF